MVKIAKTKSCQSFNAYRPQYQYRPQPDTIVDDEEDRPQYQYRPQPDTIVDDEEDRPQYQYRPQPDTIVDDEEDRPQYQYRPQPDTIVDDEEDRPQYQYRPQPDTIVDDEEDRPQYQYRPQPDTIVDDEEDSYDTRPSSEHDGLIRLMPTNYNTSESAPYPDTWKDEKPDIFLDIALSYKNIEQFSHAQYAILNEEINKKGSYNTSPKLPKKIQICHNDTQNEYSILSLKKCEHYLVTINANSIKKNNQPNLFFNAEPSYNTVITDLIKHVQNNTIKNIYIRINSHGSAGKLVTFGSSNNNYTLNSRDIENFCYFSFTELIKYLSNNNKLSIMVASCNAATPDVNTPSVIRTITNWFTNNNVSGVSVFGSYGEISFDYNAGEYTARLSKTGKYTNLNFKESFKREIS